jgi:hypothetical protein
MYVRWKTRRLTKTFVGRPIFGEGVTIEVETPDGRLLPRFVIERKARPRTPAGRRY